MSKPATEHRGAPVDDLAIRFINTKAWRLRPESEERLRSAEELQQWLKANGIDFRAEEGKLAARLNDGSDAAADFLLGARRLREAIYDIFSARIAGTTPPDTALRIFTDALSGAAPQVQIIFQRGELNWSARPQAIIEPRGLLWPIALSAAELMTGPRAERVRQCQDERGCGWLFVDQSRAGNRRWCSMGDCGNIAKSRRHYQRSR